jgi:hypothetical protein
MASVCDFAGASGSCWHSRGNEGKKSRRHEDAPLPKGALQRLILSLFVGALAFSGARTIQAQGSADEQALWKLEQNYWRYVQENHLAAYSTLWHERFLGWPSVSPVPVHKDHITDWITAQTRKV